jgi:hypothetical protein
MDWKTNTGESANVELSDCELMAMEYLDSEDQRKNDKNR